MDLWLSDKSKICLYRKFLWVSTLRIILWLLRYTICNIAKTYSEVSDKWIEQNRGGCKGLKSPEAEHELPQDEKIVRDFFIGGCYIIKEFKTNLEVND